VCERLEKKGAPMYDDMTLTSLSTTAAQHSNAQNNGSFCLGPSVHPLANLLDQTEANKQAALVIGCGLEGLQKGGHPNKYFHGSHQYLTKRLQ
jgi:hypothetical protein